MCVIVDPVSSKVLSNVALELRYLSNCYRGVVASFDFSKQPMSVNREYRIKFGVPVYNRLGLHTHEFQGANNGNLKRSALRVK